MLEHTDSKTPNEGFVLGGRHAPIGNGLAFLRAPLDQVEQALRLAHASSSVIVSPVASLADAAAALDPMEAPWTVEAILRCGEWTAYLNNFVGGGDISAIAPAIARDLDAECITAQHSPRHGAGHAAMQLWMQGPSGEPPLMSVRTLSAYCQDGRWRWWESGATQWFEQPERYRARRIRDRLDRALLITYLGQLDIHPDDPSFFADGLVVRQIVDWPRRRESVAESRASQVDRADRS